MTDLVGLLNELLKAERAGARLLADWMAEAPPASPLYEELRAVQRDEATNCAILIRHVQERAVRPVARPAPSTARRWRYATGARASISSTGGRHGW